MKNVSKLIVLVVVTVFMTAEVFAETRGGKRYKARVKTQQARVKEGVQSGDFSRRESHALKRSAQHTQNMRKRFAADGDLNNFEKRRLQQNMNHRSRQIKRFKNNDKEPKYIVQDGTQADKGGSDL